jgi:hypothetical protein
MGIQGERQRYGALLIRNAQEQVVSFQFLRDN